MRVRLSMASWVMKQRIRKMLRLMKPWEVLKMAALCTDVIVKRSQDELTVTEIRQKRQLFVLRSKKIIIR